MFKYHCLVDLCYNHLAMIVFVVNFFMWSFLFLGSFCFVFVFFFGGGGGFKSLLLFFTSFFSTRVCINIKTGRQTLYFID